MKNNRGELIRYDEVIEVSIAAQKYHYQPITLQRWIKKKLVPGFRFRRKYYIYQKQLKQYIESL